jgi:hypothetical protein
MSWVGHVACMEGERNMHRVFVQNLKVSAHLKQLGMDGVIISTPFLNN